MIQSRFNFNVKAIQRCRTLNAFFSETSISSYFVPFSSGRVTHVQSALLKLYYIASFDHYISTYQNTKEISALERLTSDRLISINAGRRFYLVAGVNRRKMASGNEDGDLIDLGNDACVPRVAVDDPTPEEQEHLLDVCPPKLEQKLSLTKRQERVPDSADKGDVLVTLGHDQVVPIRKRIDVVSSDTIKRVRDITRNLEPVIRRTTCSATVNEEQRPRGDARMVDRVATTIHERDERAKGGGSRKHVTAKRGEDETYEAREISNAFDFLAEHDDNVEEQVETSFGRSRNGTVDSGRSISSLRPLIEEGDARIAPCPHESPSSGEVDERKGVAPCERYLDNPAFESSPNSSGSRHEDSPDVGDRMSSAPRARVVLKRGRGQEDNAAFKRERKRRSFRGSRRKSWTEGTSPSPAATDGPSGVDRSASLEEYRRVPSIPPVDRGISSFLTR